MLYIGHFSFDEIKEEKVRHGYFTCIIDADHRETAVAKFSDHILDMKKSEAAFASLVKVYIEDIIQVKAIPEDPIITVFQSSEGKFPKSVTISLPAVFKDGIEAFGLPANVEKHEEKNTAGYQISEPFMRFDDMAPTQP